MFPARLEHLRNITAFLERFCSEHAIERTRCLRLNLVLEELFVNSIEHGHRGDSEAPIWVTLDARPGAVHITYEDTAPPFNPFARLSTHAELQKVGGLGVLLTRELAAGRDYAYLFGRNRIRMTLSS
jgi:serine/threonine-protein kinase RsbW